MQAFSTRELLRSHIGNYHRAKNMLNLHVSLDVVDAQVQGSGEGLLNFNSGWWCDHIKPELKGSELEKYAQAIEAINALLEIESEGREYFEP
jgi:hypothetical protein